MLLFICRKAPENRSHAWRKKKIAKHLFTVVCRRAGQANRLKSRLHLPLLVPTLPVQMVQSHPHLSPSLSPVPSGSLLLLLLLLLMVTLQLHLNQGCFLPRQVTHQSDIPHVSCALQWLSRGRWRCMELGSGGRGGGWGGRAVSSTAFLDLQRKRLSPFLANRADGTLPFVRAGSHSPSRV